MLSRALRKRVFFMVCVSVAYFLRRRVARAARASRLSVAVVGSGSRVMLRVPEE